MCELEVTEASRATKIYCSYKKDRSYKTHQELPCEGYESSWELLRVTVKVAKNY